MHAIVQVHGSFATQKPVGLSRNEAVLQSGGWGEIPTLRTDSEQGGGASGFAQVSLEQKQPRSRLQIVHSLQHMSSPRMLSSAATLAFLTFLLSVS